MFVAAVITTWVEALKALFDEDYPNEDMQGIPVLTDFPMVDTNYPGFWLDFTVEGDVRNVGIGHVEYVDSDDEVGLRPVYRWEFGGNVSITAGALGNLERARLLDELTKAIAVARVDENAQGIIRETVERNGMIGLNVVWETFQIGGFAETPGTPWATDDVIYEATVTLELEGEVVLDPETGALVPLSKVIITALNENDPAEMGTLPQVGSGGWQ